MSNTIITITNADGSVRRTGLPQRVFKPYSGSLERYGGYGECTVETTIPFAAGTTVQIGDRLEVTTDGARLYRGYVSALTASDAEPPTLNISAYGRAMLIRKLPCTRNYAFVSGRADVRDAFIAVCNDTVTSVKGPGGVQLVTSVVGPSAIGASVFSLQARNKMLGDVLDSLMTSAANLCTWGVDVDEDGYDRMYIRPISPPNPPTWTIPVPGRKVEKADGENQAGDLVNIAIVHGGSALWPQLLHNGDFALPVYQEDQAGNVLMNGDFELSGSLSTLTGWDGVLTGASIKQRISGDHSFQTPYSGGNFVELDNPGEYIEQNRDATLTRGHTYTLSLYSAKEVQDQTLAGTMQLKLYSGAGQTGTLIYDTGAVDITPTLGQKWDYKSISISVPTSSPAIASYKLHIECTSISSAHGDQGGLTIDDVQLYDASVVYQDGWTTVAIGGSAEVVAADWARRDSPLDGTCVYLNANSTDVDGQDLKLTQLSGQRYKLNGGQEMRFGVFLKRASEGPAPPKFFLETRWFRSDGSETFTGSDRSASYDASSFTGTGWQYFEHVATAPADAASGDANVTWRGNGALLVALASVRDFLADSMGPDHTGDVAHPERYLVDGNLLYVIHCDDAGLATWLGTTPSYAGSIATYGPMAGDVTDQNIQDIFGAYAVADNLFQSSAAPLRRPSLTLIDDTVPYWPGQTVSLQGAQGPALSPIPLPIARVRWNYDGILHKSLELERELPDENLVTQRLILDQIRKYGPGNTGGSSYSSSSSSGTGTSPSAPSIASSTVLGITRLSIDPATPTAPIAVGLNDMGPAVTPDALGIVGPVYVGADAWYQFNVGWQASTTVSPRAGTLMEWQYSTDGGSTWAGLPGGSAASASIYISSGTVTARVRHAAGDGSVSSWATFSTQTYAAPTMDGGTP